MPQVLQHCRLGDSADFETIRLMLAFQFHNQIARLRQFAFGLVRRLIVWLGEWFQPRMGLCWACRLGELPDWAALGFAARIRVIADHPGSRLRARCR